MKPLKIQNELTIRDSHGVDIYFSEIQKYEPLKPQEEVELCERIRNGDEKAKEKLILHNLKFVISVAKRYQSLGYRLGDLIAIGNIGIIKAANNFDHTKGFKFISYAVWWIRQQIMSEIGFKANGIKLPGNRVSMMYRINRFKDEFYTKNEREPTICEIAEHVGISEQLATNIIIASEDMSSINVPMEDDSEKDMSDTIRDDDESYERIDGRMSARLTLEPIIRKLDEREKFIIKAYYGIDMERMDEDDMCAFLGISERQLKYELARITDKMRKLK